jgi:ribosomal protein L11 methyltransferase
LNKRHREKSRGWTGNIRSIEVGEKLRIVPYWEIGLTASDRLDVIVDPGPAFGAGNHPATVMALQLVEVALDRSSAESQFPSMLDVGTGTGILAIAGKRLGSGFTVGVDVDSAAIYTARRNLSLNGLTSEDSIELLIGGAESIRGSFHIVSANLVAPVLLKLRKDLTNLVERFLILSGIADAMASEVLESFGSEGLDLLVSKHDRGWNAALFARKK